MRHTPSALPHPALNTLPRPGRRPATAPHLRAALVGGGRPPPDVVATPRPPCAAPARCAGVALGTADWQVADGEGTWARGRVGRYYGWARGVGRAS